MTTFILIILFYDASHGASSMTQAEFTSRAKCEQAQIVAKKEFSGWGNAAYAVCVEK